MASWEPENEYEVSGAWIASVSFFAVVIVVLVLAGVALAVHHPDNKAHTCYAPCTVVLPGNTLEDEFDFDYGWRDKHTPVVGVWVDPNGADRRAGRDPAVEACIGNDAYRGATEEDTWDLFRQCLADYHEAGR